MAVTEPVPELHPDFSSEDAPPTPWSHARGLLEKAEVYWLATVHPDGRPNVTPLICVWLDGALYFCTGPGERKAKAYASKYGPPFRFSVRDGAFLNDEGG